MPRRSLTVDAEIYHEEFIEAFVHLSRRRPWCLEGQGSKENSPRGKVLQGNADVKTQVQVGGNPEAA
jgi:hypothetical protein